MAVFAPVLAPHNPTTQGLETSQTPPIGFTQTETTTQLIDGETERVEETIEPSWDHPLGTDQFGHDMLSRLIYGARTSLAVGFGAGLMITVIGTVLGIITAFQGIASSGSGGLSAVSAGISEALIETALGLAVAIPAVLAFNYLSTKITRDEAALTAAAGELLDSVEGWAEAEIKETEALQSQRQGAKRERVA